MANLAVKPLNSSTKRRKFLVPNFHKLSILGSMSLRGDPSAKRARFNPNRSSILKLWDNSCPEISTPLITPTDGEFSMDLDRQNDESGAYMELDHCPLDEDNDKENIPLEHKTRGCPPAPRIDNGSFDYSFGPGHDSSFEPDMTADSSMISSTEDSGFASSRELLSLDNLFISAGPRGPRTEKQVEVAHTRTQDDFETWQVPQAPRPDTGAWSLNTEHAEHGTNCIQMSRAWALRYYGERSQLNNIAKSASLEPATSDYSALGSECAPEMAPNNTPTRSTGWNLGLGLTLDSIAEPCGYGSSIGEISMEFADESFFGVDSGSMRSSAADMTFSNVIEASPVQARVRPSNSAPHEPGLSATPRFAMLSLQEYKCVDRQRGQCSTMPIPETQRNIYARGISTEQDAVDTELPQGIYQGSLGGRSREIELTGTGFAAEELFPCNNSGAPEAQSQASTVFGLLPPIEL